MQQAYQQPSEYYNQSYYAESAYQSRIEVISSPYPPYTYKSNQDSGDKKKLFAQYLSTLGDIQIEVDAIKRNLKKHSDYLHQIYNRLKQANSKSDLSIEDIHSFLNQNDISLSINQIQEIMSIKTSIQYEQFLEFVTGQSLIKISKSHRIMGQAIELKHLEMGISTLFKKEEIFIRIKEEIKRDYKLNLDSLILEIFGNQFTIKANDLVQLVQNECKLRFSSQAASGIFERISKSKDIQELTLPIFSQFFGAAASSPNIVILDKLILIQSFTEPNLNPQEQREKSFSNIFLHPVEFNNYSSVKSKDRQEQKSQIFQTPCKKALRPRHLNSRLSQRESQGKLSNDKQQVTAENLLEQQIVSLISPYSTRNRGPYSLSTHFSSQNTALDTQKYDKKQAIIQSITEYSREQEIEANNDDKSPLKSEKSQSNYSSANKTQVEIESLIEKETPIYAIEHDLQNQSNSTAQQEQGENFFLALGDAEKSSLLSISRTSSYREIDNRDQIIKDTSSMLFDVIEGHKELDAHRVNLLNNTGFNLGLVFSLLDQQGLGYIKKDQISQILFDQFGFDFSQKDIDFLYNRFSTYDQNKDNLDFTMFCDIFLPKYPTLYIQPLICKRLQIHEESSIQNLEDCIEDLVSVLSIIVQIEDRIERYRFIEVNDFQLNLGKDLIREQLIENLGYYSSERELNLLMEYLDKDQKGWISMSDLSYEIKM